MKASICRRTDPRQPISPRKRPDSIYDVPFGASDPARGYLAIPATDVAFDYLASGKPQLTAEQNPRALRFNVSHSANTALIAIGSGYQLGVDVEKIRDEVNATSLAERYLFLRERAELRVLPNHFLSAGFFACWTREEAFLKATGTGLSFPLADFSVSAHPDLYPE